MAFRDCSLFSTHASRLGLAALLYGAMCIPLQAQAQTEKNDTIATVVVTAQRRAENIQSVPMSIAAFSGDTLENQNIHSVRDLTQLVPNLSITRGNSNRNMAVDIRGVGSSGTNPGIDPDVGIYLDGVYMPSAPVILASLLDIATVEVLRGPQGTLYGRNTAVGAININTREPTQTPEAMIYASLGNYFARRVSGYLSGGLTDHLAGRIALYMNSNEGYEKNLYYHQAINGSKQSGGRGRLVWTSTDKLSVDLIGYYTRIHQNCCTPDQLDPTGVGGIATPGFLAAMTAAGHPFINFDDKDHKLDSETVGDEYTTNEGVSVKVDWELPWQDTLTSITAYDSFDNEAKSLATHGLPLQVFDYSQAAGQGLETKTVSQELRLTSPTDQFLEYVAGFYYFRGSLAFDNAGRLGDGANRVFPIAGGVTPHPGDRNFSYYDQITKSYAVYGQATANLTSRLRLIGGLRYSSDRKRASLLGVNVTGGTPVQTLLFNQLLFPAVSVPDLDRTDNKVTWSATVQYQISDAIMGYATAASGYKDGGFNASINSSNSPISFSPETTTNYELGVKSALFSGHLVLNADIYRMTIKNFQSSIVNPQTGTGFIVSNAGNRRVQGLEMHVDASVLDHLKLIGALAYSDAKYTDYRAGQCPTYPGPFLPKPNASSPGSCNFTGLTPSGNPKWRWNLTANWQQPFYTDSTLSWFATATLAYTADQYLNSSLDPRSHQDAYTLLNMQIGITSDTGWRMDLWVRNLTDVSYYQTKVPQPAGGLISGGGNAGASGFAGWYGQPRTFGIEASYRY